MRASYGRNEDGFGVRHTRRRAGRRRQRGLSLGYREKHRLIQLFVCFLLFGATLVGKGVFPQQMDAWRESALTVLQSDTDFKAVFVGLGRAISEGEPILETLGELWIETIGGLTSPVSNQEPPIQAPTYEQELASLAAAANGSRREALAKRLGIEWNYARESESETDDGTGVTMNETAGWAEREDASQPALLEAQPQPVYNGPALPDNCTMDKVTLEISETMTPVMGVISSDYGYRIHPIDGENKYHYGTDIAADIGTPVYAFADGVVDFIGESEAYGQYIQLRHNGGVTTFYAHCSKLCAKKGQKVKIGDTIAKVGESGNTTGPHLHFEIRLNGVFLNPIYYIDAL